MNNFINRDSFLLSTSKTISHIARLAVELFQ